MRLDLICAGAAKAVIEGLAERFRAEHGATIAGTFGAVGAMQERLTAGAPCDVVVLTDTLIGELARSGQVREATIREIGRVHTGIAIRAGDAMPDITTEHDLARALDAATSVFVPDTERSTAGRHFMTVLKRLDLGDVVPRIRSFPNGATAMAALASATDEYPIGCTQVTEIRYTDGVTLVGALPKRLELATMYAAAVCERTSNAELAAQFVELLTRADARSLRDSGGFTP
ncbi:MAG TPA: substrate-binding domain-containing protein [Casimicrobiaceae bacterium]|nr:substrate-binding domain-containing protein [Casimicrobiaceae bacterium]